MSYDDYEVKPKARDRRRKKRRARKNTLAEALTECYRYSSGTPNGQVLHQRNQIVDPHGENEHLPKKIGMLPHPARCHKSPRKSFGENLSPLYRWLDKQVNRPWDKVHAELCKECPKKGTLNLHVWDHLEGYVVHQGVRMHRGVPFTVESQGWSPVLRRGMFYHLYVNPESGLLLKPPTKAPKWWVVDTRKIVCRESDGQWFKVEVLENAWNPKGDRKAYREVLIQQLRDFGIRETDISRVLPSSSWSLHMVGSVLTLKGCEGPKGYRLPWEGSL